MQESEWYLLFELMELIFRWTWIYSEECFYK